jgi:hypothetical protein
MEAHLMYDAPLMRKVWPGAVATGKTPCRVQTLVNWKGSFIKGRARFACVFLSWRI